MNGMHFPVIAICAVVSLTSPTPASQRLIVLNRITYQMCGTDTGTGPTANNFDGSVFVKYLP